MAALTQLHHEIDALAELLGATPQQVAAKAAAADEIRALAQAIWGPSAYVAQHGSTATGAALRGSALDVVVGGIAGLPAPDLQGSTGYARDTRPRVAEHLTTLQQKIESEARLVHSVRVLATAKVPLMTLALAGGAAVNVTLAPHREAALPARRTAAAIAAQLEARPHARKLLLLVKALLAPRGALAEFCGTLGGGVSSFVATLLVLAFCALQEPPAGSSVDLGQHLLAFFQFYGDPRHFDLSRHVIDIAERSGFGAKGAEHDADRLTVLEPTLRGDVAGECYRARQLFKRFADLQRRLCEAGAAAAAPEGRAAALREGTHATRATGAAHSAAWFEAHTPCLCTLLDVEALVAAAAATPTAAAPPTSAAAEPPPPGAAASAFVPGDGPGTWGGIVDPVALTPRVDASAAAYSPLDIASFASSSHVAVGGGGGGGGSSLAGFGTSLASSAASPRLQPLHTGTPPEAACVLASTPPRSGAASAAQPQSGGSGAGLSPAGAAPPLPRGGDTHNGLRRGSRNGSANGGARGHARTQSWVATSGELPHAPHTGRNSPESAAAELGHLALWNGSAGSEADGAISRRVSVPNSDGSGPRSIDGGGGGGARRPQPDGRARGGRVRSSDGGRVRRSPSHASAAAMHSAPQPPRLVPMPAYAMPPHVPVILLPAVPPGRPDAGRAMPAPPVFLPARAPHGQHPYPRPPRADAMRASQSGGGGEWHGYASNGLPAPVAPGSVQPPRPPPAAEPLQPMVAVPSHMVQHPGFAQQLPPRPTNGRAARPPYVPVYGPYPSYGSYVMLPAAQIPAAAPAVPVPPPLAHDRGPHGGGPAPLPRPQQGRGRHNGRGRGSGGRGFESDGWRQLRRSSDGDGLGVESGNGSRFGGASSSGFQTFHHHLHALGMQQHQLSGGFDAPGGRSGGRRGGFSGPLSAPDGLRGRGGSDRHSWRGKRASNDAPSSGASGGHARQQQDSRAVEDGGGGEHSTEFEAPPASNGDAFLQQGAVGLAAEEAAGA